jgi:hypothetical protein
MLVSATAKMNVFGFLVSTLYPFQRGFDWKNLGWQMAEGFGRARHFVRAGPCERPPSRVWRAEDCPPYRSSAAGAAYL